MRQNIKKRILSLIMIFTTTFVASVPAYAEWKQNSNQYWNYIGPDGTLKTGWLQNNGQWYFFNGNGNMLTGWITDKGTWYYMRENGSLNDSKTTTVIPSEIQSIINIVNPFSGGLKLRYVGKSYIKEASGLSNYGLADKWVVGLKAENEYGDDADFYYIYDPYNCKIFKLYDNLEIKYLGKGNTNDNISKEQAIQNIKIYLSENNAYIPSKITIEEDTDNTYLIHCYDDMGDHTATSAWFYVDKSTGYIMKV
jgi:glucan-binding YG repeat protein